MHRIWDSGIIDRAGQGEDGWLADLIAMGTNEARGRAQSGFIEDWATESLLAARGPRHSLCLIIQPEDRHANRGTETGGCGCPAVLTSGHRS
jgi:hypothetical protein